MKKKSYVCPTLRKHGAIEKITLGMMGSGRDASGMMGRAPCNC